MVVKADGTVVQKNHYYPFGMEFAENSGDSDQPYKYNGKELDRMHGLNMYDYSARYYEPAIGRFTTVDPLAEKYYSVSPYVYCLNNPIIFVDKDGMSPSLGDIKRDITTVAKTALSFANGLVRATVDNVVWGTSNLRETGTYSSAQAYNTGQDVGDALSIVVGTAEAVGGITEVVGGALITVATDGGAIPVSGAAVLDGLAKVVHGTGMTISAADNLSSQKGRVSEMSSNGRGGGKGERGRTAKPEGTDNPFKKMTPDSKNPNKVNYKDANGKTQSKPKPEGFDEYWNKKHPPKENKK